MYYDIVWGCVEQNEKRIVEIGHNLEELWIMW